MKYDPQEWGAAVYEDGYTITTTIPGVRGLHPPCKMTYRPTLLAERTQYKIDVATAVDGEAVAKRVAQLLAAHVQSWDMETVGGREVDPKNVELVKSVNPALFDKLADIVNSYRAREEVADVKNFSTGSGSKS